MPGFSIQITIDAPAERVFHLATDFPRRPEIFRAVQRVEMITDGPLGVGTRFRETRVLFGREATEEMLVTKLLSARALSLESLAHGARYRSDYTFASERGQTAVTVSFAAKPLTLGAKILGFLGGAMLAATRRVVQEDLEALKTSAEAGA